METEKITRVEVIDSTKTFEEGGGRTYVHWNANSKVELSLQDNFRTLKIFISKRNEQE